MANPATSLHVEFFTRPKEDKAASLESKRPIFKDKEMVRIKFVGDTRKVFEGPADASSVRDPETNRWLTYADRFPEHYEAFKRGVSVRASGTLLSEAQFLSPSRVKEYEAKNIHTLETLVALDDRAIRGLGASTRSEMEIAQGILDKADHAAAATALEAENAALRAQIEEMKAASAAPSDADLKAIIKQQTGKAPVGNPNRETLERMVAESGAA